MSEKSKLALMSLCVNPRKGEDWIMRLTSARLFHAATATA